MEKWDGKVALVTGAASGIGAAVSVLLVKQGLTVVGLDIQEDKVLELAESLSGERGKLVPLQVNLRHEGEICAAFEWVENNLGGADILVNNAGVIDTSLLIDGSTDKWKAILDVNVLAVAVCSREYLRSMRERNNDTGHIVIVNSVAAYTPGQFAQAGMYYASKCAVKALSMCLRRELADKKSTIKVTCVSPGRTKTAMNNQVSKDPDSVVAMETSDVAGVIIDALSASSVTQICDVILTPVPTMFTIY